LVASRGNSNEIDVAIGANSRVNSKLDGSGRRHVYAALNELKLRLAGYAADPNTDATVTKQLEGGSLTVVDPRNGTCFATRAGG